jgi:hypothetical protein
MKKREGKWKGSGGGLGVGEERWVGFGIGREGSRLGQDEGAFVRGSRVLRIGLEENM